MAAGRRPTLVSPENRPPTPVSCSRKATPSGSSRSRKALRLPPFTGSLRPRNNSPMRDCRPAALQAESAAMVCISVSPVPPDFEIATKREVASGSFASSAPKLAGSRLSMKWMRGPSRKAPTPGTA